MPSKSKAQERMMAAASHNPAFAKKVGVPVSVAKDFNQADQRKHHGGHLVHPKINHSSGHAAVANKISRGGRRAR